MAGGLAAEILGGMFIFVAIRFAGDHTLVRILIKMLDPARVE